MTNLASVLKSRHYYANKGLYSQRCGFPSSHEWMWEFESWTIKKDECWRIDAFELWCWRRLEHPLDCKEIQPVHPKGDQSLIFIGMTDAETEAPILWSADTKNRLIGKDPDAEKDWRREENGTKEDEVFWCHHRLNGNEFEQAPGDGEGPYTTEQLNTKDNQSLKCNMREWKSTEVSDK